MSDDKKTLQLNVGDRKLYPSNFCRLQSSSEDFTIDFGVQTANLQADILASVVVSPFTAKRLHELLTKTIAQHEAQFGQIILDASKRSIISLDTTKT